MLSVIAGGGHLRRHLDDFIPPLITIDACECLASYGLILLGSPGRNQCGVTQRRARSAHISPREFALPWPESRPRK